MYFLVFWGNVNVKGCEVSFICSPAYFTVFVSVKFLKQNQDGVAVPDDRVQYEGLCIVDANVLELVVIRASPIMGVSPDTSSCLPRWMRENGEFVAVFGAGLYTLRSALGCTRAPRLHRIARSRHQPVLPLPKPAK